MLAGAAVLAALGCTPSDKPVGAVRGLDIGGANYARDFRLSDAEGRERTLADYRGKVVLVFFGFTQCPDVCPTALSGAAEMLKLLGDDGANVQVLFVSLDPERDTPEVLKHYMASFHPSFVALRGDLERTQQTADAYKVFFRKVPLASSYTIDHTALTYVYDRNGELRVALRPQQTPREQADDVRALLSASPAGSVSPTPAGRKEAGG